MKEAKVREQRRLSELKSTLYEQQRNMQNIQSELEEISAANSALEHDFENEISKKNQTSKEIGQIVNSINNIFNICQQQQARRGKKISKDEVKVNEESKNLVPQLISKLDRAHQTVDELVKVYAEYGGEYNRDRAYIEDIEARAAAERDTKQQAAQQQIAGSTKKTSKGFQGSFTVEDADEQKTTVPAKLDESKATTRKIKTESFKK